MIQSFTLNLLQSSMKKYETANINTRLLNKIKTPKTTDDAVLVGVEGPKTPAPPPTANTTWSSVALIGAICSLSQYNYPHRGDFSISISNLRYLAPKGHFGAFPRSQKLVKNDPFFFHISGI